jgi:hypothetical protein
LLIEEITWWISGKESWPRQMEWIRKRREGKESWPDLHSYDRWLGINFSITKQPLKWFRIKKRADTRKFLL